MLVHPARERGAYSEVATIRYGFPVYLALGFDMYTPPRGHGNQHYGIDRFESS